MSFSLTPVLIGLCVALAGLVLYLILRQSQKNPSHQDSQTFFLSLQQRIDALQNQLRVNLDGNTQSLQQKMESLTKQLDSRLGESAKLSSETNKQVNERLDNAAKVFGELQNRLGKLNEANEKIYNVGKDISSLQEILKRPKARGSLGEFLMADLMSEMLPQNRYELQYRFKNNELVDGVIKIGEQLLSIDSKFPLENFRRLLDLKGEEGTKALKKQFITDVKKHIDAIAKKYIQPEEGTFDFAFMYIPAENVFYEVIVQDEETAQETSLQAYALKKRVIPVSPNSFYAYLAALMHALRGQRMQKNIFEVVAQVRHLATELGKFRDDFEKVGYHLNNLRSSYEASEKRLGRYQDRLEKVQETENLIASEDKPIKLIK